ncbi:MAG: iron-containing alcohol dehydrogenase [Myxococcales bacterium]|nr:iron-containing alcohol dehydrogenase [Myxococcales bacterium]MCB9642768.1 iron-containing alcohol dehydrogenase [Myxococcales bacterium]
MSSIRQYNFPTRIRVGLDARKEVISTLKDQGLSTPLIVTDRGLAKLPVLQDYVTVLQEAGLQPAVFSEIWGNPVTSQVTAGVEAFRAANADAVIAFGGGAAMDVAKVIALMIHHPGDIFDYEDGIPNGRPVDQAIPLIIAIPTTAGTGSEVGRSSVISDEETHRKRIIFDPRLLPSLTLLDPQVTLGLPASITASTGVDALTHLVEAFLAKGHHPLCDGIALEGIHLVARYLAPCVHFAQRISQGETLSQAEHARHIEARERMLEAAMMGAVAFQKGLGLTHSCAHALSTVCDMHHGLANALMIVPCMEFNAPAVPERFARMAQAAGLEQHNSQAFIQWLRDLNQDLAIPATLADAGVKEEHVHDLVKWSMVDVCHPSGPRDVTEEDFQQIFHAALQGKSLVA